MAVTASGLFVPTMLTAMDGTQVAFNWEGALKYALFSNSITPNFQTDTAYGTGTYASNEVSGTGWAAGGVSLAGQDVVNASGTLNFTATDITASGTTLPAARCGVIYQPSISNKAILLDNFGADFTTVAGTLSIPFTSGIVWTWDVTP